MKKIGEISILYEVSPRMLRYYETKGVIESIRKENNYRYYDTKAEERIKQILLLKELDFTIKEIEKVFNDYTSYDLIQILFQKKLNVQDKVDELKKLETIIDNFLFLLSNSDENMFDSLSLSLSNSKTRLRGGSMKEEVIRIVNLPEIKVAVFKGYGENPEDKASEKANKFIKENKLVGFRHFGFNNPDPQEGKSEYGYEIWVTVDKDYEGVNSRIYKGGLYASITTIMPDIGKTWGKLYNLVKEDDRYDFAYTEPKDDGVSDNQWLEECTDYEFFFIEESDESSKQLDLLMPIKRI